MQNILDRSSIEYLGLVLDYMPTYMIYHYDLILIRGIRDEEYFVAKSPFCRSGIFITDSELEEMKVRSRYGIIFDCDEGSM